MKYANCYILSSKSEAFPNVLLEFIAFDALIVSTACILKLNYILQNTLWKKITPVRDWRKLG